MVNRGPSRDCQRCRQRHLKCDQIKPGCQRCMRLGIGCPGYQHTGNIVIKDVTTKVVRKHTAPPSESMTATGAPKISTSKLTKKQNVPRGPPTRRIPDSVCFFFDRYIIDLDKGELPSSAYLDHLIPLYLHSDESSCLAMSVNAMASRAFRRQSLPQSSPLPPSAEDMKALQTVQKSLTRPDERFKDETLLAVLCLDFTEYLTVNGSEIPITRSHIYGAAALINNRGSDSFKDDISRSLLAGTMSNMLLLTLWSNDISKRRMLDLLPDIDLQDYDPGVEIHQLLIKVIQLENKILYNTQDPSYRPSRRSHPQLFAQMMDQYSRIVDWLNHVPPCWKHVITPGDCTKISESLSSDESRSVGEIAYVFAQWYCTRMSTLRLLHAVLNNTDVMTTSDHSMLQAVKKETQQVAEDLVQLMPILDDGSDGSDSTLSNRRTSPPSPAAATTATATTTTTNTTSQGQSKPLPSPSPSQQSSAALRERRRDGAPECRGKLLNVLRWLLLDLVKETDLVPGFNIEPDTLQILKDKFEAVNAVISSNA